MTLFYLGAFLIASVVIWAIVSPLVTGKEAPTGRGKDEPSEAEAKKRVALLALRDVEQDRFTGKLDDADYGELRGELVAEALQAIDEAEGEPERRYRRSSVADPGTSPRFCSTCGHRLEVDSRFCSDCGVRVAR